MARVRPVLVASAAVMLAVLPAPASAPAPTVYAHRGGAHVAPENTLGAFRKAHADHGSNGVWIELDAQPTKDGVLVVIHDDSLDRTTGCSGKVAHKTAAEVTACDARDPFPTWPFPEPVPTLEQVLIEGRTAGWRLLVELKDIPGEANFEPTAIAMADELIRLVGVTGFPAERLVVQSFWPPAIDRVELMAPQIRTALLTTSRLPGPPPGVHVGFYLTENALYATARGYEISAPDFTTPDLSSETVAAAHALGREVVVWTVNTASDAGLVASFGVDGIITDRPAEVYAAIAE